MKIKLDKLIAQKNKKNDAIDYSVLDKTKRAMDEDHAEEQHDKGIQRKPKQNFWVALASVAACIAVIIAIVVPLSLRDTPTEPASFYCYDGEYEILNYDSIATYNSVHGTNLLYFDTSRDIEKNAYVYVYNEVEALLRERILLLDTFEEIDFYVGNKQYDFDFLKSYQNLTEEVDLCGRSILFETEFDEKVYLYTTRVVWIEGEYKYRIRFSLEDPEAWKDYFRSLFD